MPGKAGDDVDRFYRGFVAGMVAAVPLNAWSLFSYHILGLTQRRLLDWAGMMVFGVLPRTAVQVVLALFMQLVWSGLRGIFFVYLLRSIGSQGLIGKAVIFSVIVSFLEESIVVLFKVPNLVRTTTGTLISTLVGAVMWGAVLALLLRRLDTEAEA
jgi:hypothetical protein